ncbi:MAG: non-homologous end-joining DNA ligase [Chloroflexi bacterium]|nr:non-homologous end-joining DNA ligase [Chloroflexota bacterium]
MPSPERAAPSPASEAPGNLAEYDAKRDFAQTPEPGPHTPASPTGPLTFVVQQHRATRMHYDVRLEVGGVMPSWPVPRGPSTNPRERRLAIQTEDHPLDYASFEGVIPSGQYGAGEVIVWDNGTYSPDEDGRLSFADREDAEARVRAGIEAGKLSITFRGRKLKGSWTFVKTQASEDSWLLIKHQDVAADPDRELTAEDTSVISGRSIADLQAGRLPDPARTGTPPHLGDLPGVEPGAPPPDLKPMQAHLSEEPFDDPGWFFEPKLDGIRALVTIEDGAVALRARSGRDITAQYPTLVRSLAEQPVASAVLDGEIVTLDERGVPSFELLQQRMGLQNADEIAVADAERPVLFFAFDILALDGHDLRRVALEHRVEVLARVLLPGPLVQRVETFAADGIAAFEAAKALGLEGVVAKRRDSAYEAGRRSPRWLKVKARQTGDFIVGGHHTSEGAAAGPFGALLLGTRDEDGALRYVGRVGTGFDDAMLRDLRASLDAIETDANPFTEEPPDVDRVTFVRPDLVAEVAYANETREGILRAPSFLRLRPDKPPSEVRRVATAAPPASSRTATAPTDADAIASVLAQLDGDAAEMELAVGAHEVRVTNLDKVMWPAHQSSEGGDSPAVTKRDLLRYLAQVSPWLLPHMRDRPVTLTRYPDGIDGNSFYQKHYDRPPAFVETAEVYVDSSRGDETALLCNNLATLLWLGQLADLELHVSLARASAEPDGHHLPMVFSGSKEQIERSALGHPDFVLFDLDPYIYAGDEASGEEPQLNRRAFAQTVEVARWLKELLDAASLSSFVKTSGATGLHIHVPVLRHFDYPAVRAVANTFAEFLQRAHPAEITLEWETQRRTGRIFVDVNQNARIRNMATAFSPRPKPGAPVSMTLRWDELDDVYPSDFTIHTALARLAEVGDPWADIMRHKHDLRALIEAQ